jgi:hypothetical protein
MGQIYALPGEPSSYIQVNEFGLKNCLANQSNNIQNCVNSFIVGPNNGTQSGVHSWMGSSLPPNPACPQRQNFQNLENFESNNSSLLSQNNITMIIVIVVTLLIALTK